jgi:hypothetical protein
VLDDDVEAVAGGEAADLGLPGNARMKPSTALAGTPAARAERYRLSPT